MFTKSRRFTLKAIVLASLSLFLFGCGTGSDPKAPVLKEVRGVVSDPTTGQPYANAIVNAYAVDASGNVATTTLNSVPPEVRSDGQGNFVLNIPDSYAGAIMLEATLTSGTGKTVLAARNNVIRLFLPSVPARGQIVAINLASEMVVQYIEQNLGGKFTPDNLRKAILVLEPFFGPNFNQVYPAAVGSTPSPVQQQLLVMTEAINSLIKSGATIADLVKFVPGTTRISLGEGAVFTALKAAVDNASNKLINEGLIPGSYHPPTITPISEPTDAIINDKTPPSAPQNLRATSTTSSVTLSWDASTEAGVTWYYVYRNDVFSFALPASEPLTYTDTMLTSATLYKYELKARDAAGNISTGISLDVTTKPILTYKISGRITINGSGLPSVYVVISGFGSGVFLTDSDGNYTITGVLEGSYTITPALDWYTFTPASRPAVVTTADITGLDFTAVAVTPGTITGGVTYPPGTIIGGISYPSGMVIGGITYPTATIIGGVVYPTGTVIGGVTYPNGVIIGGVSYPAGTIVGGVAFPVGAVTAGVTYPSGTVIGGVTYPTGTIIGGVSYPGGVLIGGVIYPAGTLVGGVAFPIGSVIAGTTYPTGTIAGGLIYPGSTLNGTVTYPNGTLAGLMTYPTGTVFIKGFEWILTP